MASALSIRACAFHSILLILLHQGEWLLAEISRTFSRQYVSFMSTAKWLPVITLYLYCKNYWSGNRFSVERLINYWKTINIKEEQYRNDTLISWETLTLSEFLGSIMVTKGEDERIFCAYDKARESCRNSACHDEKDDANWKLNSAKCLNLQKASSFNLKSAIVRLWR